MIKDILMTVTDINKGKNYSSEIANKIPDFSISNSIQDVSNKIPDFKLSAKDVNSNVDLTNSQKEKVLESSSYSEFITESITSTDELNIYQDANLNEIEVDGNKSLCRNDIDKKKCDDFGVSNLDRMEHGKPPLDISGRPIELHHIGQNKDSPLAELTVSEHRSKDNNSVLHDTSQESSIDRTAFNKQKSDHWKVRAEQLKIEA